MAAQHAWPTYTCLIEAHVPNTWTHPFPIPVLPPVTIVTLSRYLTPASAMVCLWIAGHMIGQVTVNNNWVTSQ